MRATGSALLASALLAACSGGGGDDDQGALERVDRDERETGAGVDAVAVAEAWIESYEGLDDEGRATLKPAGTRESAGVTHVRFRQVIDEIPVRGAQLIVHVGPDGEVVGASDSTSDARPEPGVEQELDEAGAVAIAGRAVPEAVEETNAANVVWLPDGDRLRLGWSVQLSAVGAGYSVWVDAVTGDVADARETTLHGRSAPAQSGGCGIDSSDAPAACVFVPDPATAAGTFPSLAEADDFLVPVELQGLTNPSSGQLVGEFVTVLSDVTDRDGVWDAGSQEAGFEEAMAYFWIDSAQRLIQDLGFTDIRNESFPVVARTDQVVDNGLFNPSNQTIFLGVGSGGRQDAAEDAQMILHEYGHAVLDDQVPAMIFNDAGAAYHDGFADTFAALVTVGIAEDPACIFPWYFGEFFSTGCARRADLDKVFPDDLVNEVHADGEIWSGAVFAILEGLLAAEGLSPAECAGTSACDEIRDRVLSLAIVTNEFLTGSEDLAEIGTAMALANEAAFGGQDQDLIEDVLSSRGLLGGGGVVVDPDGRPTGDVAAVEVSVDVSHSFRGDLRMDVVVVDRAGDALCQATILEPVADDDADNVSGTVDLSATACAELAPPSVDRQWALMVEDTAAQDTGQVNSFIVTVDGTPFLATGVPAPIPDADPTGVAVIVNGTGEDVPQDGTVEPGDTSGGVAFATIEIAHTFVGDLQLRVGVIEIGSAQILCSIPVLEPDPQDSSDDVRGDLDLSECASTAVPGTAWFVEAVDTVAQDTGAIERFDVFAADGSLVGAGQVPVPIPDDDPAGAAVLIAV